METANQVQILYEIVHIFHSVKTFGKHMNLTNLPLAMGK